MYVGRNVGVGNRLPPVPVGTKLGRNWLAVPPPEAAPPPRPISLLRLLLGAKRGISLEGKTVSVMFSAASPVFAVLGMGVQ